MKQNIIFKPEDKSPRKSAMENIAYFIKNDDPLRKYVFRYGSKWEEIHKEVLLGTYSPVPPRYEEIEEWPIAVTQMGEIVCMVNPKEPPKAMFLGLTGSGKSMLKHRIIDGLYLNYGYLVGLLNDYMKESTAWNYPMSSGLFIRKLRLFNQHPTPLPIVALVPNMDSPVTMKAGIPRIDIKVSFKEFLENIDTFTDLEKSATYFKNMNLEEANNMEEVEAIIKTSDCTSNVKRKILARIREYIKCGLVSNDKNLVSDLRIIGNGTSDVFTQLLKCGVIPSLITENLISSKAFPHYLKYVIDLVIKKQQEDSWFQDKKLVLAIEELNRVISLPQGSEPSIALESIKNIAQRGRFMRTGLLFCAQNRHKIPDELASNCTYTFVFTTKSNRDVEMICADLQLSNEKKKEINNLRKFECMGWTTEHFVVYDVIGNRVYTTQEFKGMIIPPVSHHSRSGGTIDFGGYGMRIQASDYASQLITKKKISLHNPDNNTRLLESYSTKMFVYEKPKACIIERLNLNKAFYPKGLRQRVITYEELKRFGLWIYKAMPDDETKMYPGQRYVYILATPDEASATMIPQAMQPKDVEMLLYNPKAQTIKMFGKDCPDILYRGVI